MGHKALRYAEEQLGVHSVFEETELLIDTIDHLYSNLEQLKADRREALACIDEREYDLVVEERVKNPQPSQAAFDRHMKEVCRNDKELKRLRIVCDRAASDIETHENDIRVREMRVKAKTARISELGGYMYYLAIVKANTGPVIPENPDKTGEQP